MMIDLKLFFNFSILEAYNSDIYTIDNQTFFQVLSHNFLF